MLSVFFIENISDKLDRDIFDKSINLKTNLEKYREEVKVFETKSNLAKTISWLIEKQKNNGSWGNDSIATTAMTMIALKNVEQPAIFWGYSQKMQDSFSKAEAFLKEKYIDNKFEDVIWDTSLVIRALTVCCSDSREFINSELIPKLIQYKVDKLNAGIHHLAQKILALSEFGVDNKTLENCIIELQTFLSSNNWKKYSPYVISQCVEVMYIDEDKFNINEFVNYIIDWLQNNSLDSANFINICSSLISIKPRLNTELEKKLRYTVSSLFGSNCFRYDGSWYHDEYITAYAILALAKYEKEILIRVPKIEFNYEISEYINSVLKSFDEYFNSETKNWIIHLLSTFGGTILLTVFIVCNNLPAWAKWLLPALGSSLLLFSLSEIIRRIKKILKL